MIDKLSWDEICELFELIDNKLKFSKAEGLVPVNIHRWGAYAAGAGIAFEVNAPIDRLLAVHENIEAAMSYLD